jgi:hypothetical protein
VYSRPAICVRSFGRQRSLLRHPRQSRRFGVGDNGSRLTTAALADNYLRLCHNPCNDLTRWIAEDKSRRVAGPIIPPPENHHDETTTRSPSLMEDARRLCGHPLHAMQGRLDADRKPGRSADDLPPRSRAGPLGHDQLRSLRAAGECDLAGQGSDSAGIGLEFSTELAALNSYYAARMAAARRALRPWEIAAALRVLQGERALAMKAVIDRWMTATRDALQRRGGSQPIRNTGLLPFTGVFRI